VPGHGDGGIPLPKNKCKSEQDSSAPTALFGASAFHGWIETAKYLSAPVILCARLLVTLNTYQVPDEQVQS
jgi:hypothetical protein